MILFFMSSFLLNILTPLFFKCNISELMTAGGLNLYQPVDVDDDEWFIL